MYKYCSNLNYLICPIFYFLQINELVSLKSKGKNPEIPMYIEVSQHISSAKNSLSPVINLK